MVWGKLGFEKPSIRRAYQPGRNWVGNLLLNLIKFPEHLKVFRFYWVSKDTAKIVSKVCLLYYPVKTEPISATLRTLFLKLHIAESIRVQVLQRGTRESQTVWEFVIVLCHYVKRKTRGRFGVSTIITAEKGLEAKENREKRRGEGGCGRGIYLAAIIGNGVTKIKYRFAGLQ